MALYKRILIGKSFHKLLNTTASYLSELAEKRREYAGIISELGAIKLESDAVGVVDIVVRGGLYGVRYRLAKSS